MKKSKQNTPAYTWGAICKGWHLVHTPSLSVIQEVMPPSTAEVKHRHPQAQQFFFILSGEATFLLADKQVIVEAGEGIHIPPKMVHQIKNETNEDLEFLVISEPHAHGDREEM